MQPYPGLDAFAQTIELPNAGVKIFFYRAGEGVDSDVPYVLLHGLGDEADTWRHILPVLASRARVYALDLPGFGRSDKPRRVYTISFFRQVIAEWLDQIGVSRAALVGHSMGAILAQSLALENPQRVEQLVMLAGCMAAKATRLNLGTLLFLVPGLGEMLYNRLRRDPQAAYRSLYRYYTDLDGLPQTERDFLFQRVNQRIWSDRQRDAFLSTLRNLALWLPDQQKSLPGKLAGSLVPARLIWGAADAINPIENGRLLAQLQPGLELVEIAGAGHNLHQEQPQAVLEAVLAPW
jgi:pimeloyl-ACP methyl ester carboxylesterase